MDSVITAVSVVVAQNWVVRITLGYIWANFDSRNDVISYLKYIGVSEKIHKLKTVGDGKGAGETLENRIQRLEGVCYQQQN